MDIVHFGMIDVSLARALDGIAKRGLMHLDLPPIHMPMSVVSEPDYAALRMALNDALALAAPDPCPPHAPGIDPSRARRLQAPIALRAPMARGQAGRR